MCARMVGLPQFLSQQAALGARLGPLRDLNGRVERHIEGLAREELTFGAGVADVGEKLQRENRVKIKNL